MHNDASEAAKKVFQVHSYSRLMVSAYLSAGDWRDGTCVNKRVYRISKLAHNIEFFILIMQKPPRFNPEGILFASPPDLTYTLPDAP